ncbi:hypothetical protein [Nitrospirillum amazonense]|uniref:Uncharacterized protein n=1 Tax=Nitrospirillum amazonense TaxID=28077 RepID=A0A560K8V9_9PROT|nr:hypothetical protein [Nitrospirillum amazonense]MDG3441734.1 hypothetical protein [Nitrospirillum amazonense]TWB79775.1 hypothetical protein FBZ87_102196 [Nitrospirillum amazonense]
MNGWKRYQTGLHGVGPHWVRIFGNSLSGTAFEDPNAEGRFAWYVADRSRQGAKTFRHGLADSVKEAKLAADAAVLDRKRGRTAAVEGEPTSSTDRNRRRVDRLLASETLAHGLIDDLTNFHKELVTAGDLKTADRVAASIRRAALGALADYMRRTAAFRARSGANMASPETMKAEEETVLDIADQLDQMADDPQATEQLFEALTDKLRQLGVFPDGDLNSAVVNGFFLESLTKSSE